ncbi:proteasome accessory factor PafA2 family protein [Actinomyces sp.]|uniref:proteasome accessory factor PafA2 family protein n=1 Tax=Actinomyces sp. TaxID=29317 RepID=UPI0026DBD4B8|nr:proteasome accessory factor PafA2 family protein [Actinomyces sp.]MDO4901511.1 proteasome accessory factor PafA2 family protein [Actinomyces sp.]
MITVQRIMGVETEYALIDRDDPEADPTALSEQLLYAYARQAAAEGDPSTLHVPAEDSRNLERGAGCRFDYSGELPTRDARDGDDHDLAPEARTDLEAGAVLTGAPTRWIQRVDRFGQHYYRGSATHAPNGSRLYVDHSHPEYASPETRGPVEAVRYDRAGDRIMHRAEQALSARRPGRIQVIKNNTDGHGSAWGAHESYAVDRRVPWALLTDLLVPFLVSRSVLCGSGRVGIGPAGEEPGFQVLARADFIEREVSLYTTRERPIVNTRDEPHADASRWRRLHVITADSSSLAVSALLRLGSTAALLSLVEHFPDRARALADRLAMADPVAAIRAFSRDPTARVRCPLAAGGQVSALEMQRAFLQEVREAAAPGDADLRGACAPVPKAGSAAEETMLVLDLWGEALDALEAGPEHAAHLVEWCAKLTLLERLRSRYGCGWDDARLRAADLQFSVVDPTTSLAARLERTGVVRSVLDEVEVETAVTTAPARTRAGGRAALLRLFPDRVWAASWTSVVVDVGARCLLRVTLPDPSSPTTAQVEQAVRDARERLLRPGLGADASKPDPGPAEEAVLVATLEALGLEVPPEPRLYSWNEGIYAEEQGEPTAP